MSAGSAVGSAEVAPRSDEESAPSYPVHDATALARICRYAFRGRLWTLVLLAFVTAVMGFTLLAVALTAKDVSTRTTVAAALAAMVFLLTVLLSHLARRREVASTGWLWAALVLYSLPLVAIAAVGLSAGFLQFLPLFLICSPLTIGIWRAARAAWMLQRDEGLAALVRKRAAWLRQADELQSALEKAARGARSDNRREMARSTSYFRLSYAIGAVFVLITVGIYGLRLLLELKLLNFGYMAEMLGQIAIEAVVPSALVWFVWALSLPLLLLTVWLLSRAQRWRALEARILRQLDPRPPILLLRSFGDDGLRLRRSRLRSMLAWIAPGRTRGLTFEHFLSRALLPIGPLIAIGEPAEKLPPLGAGRDYYQDWEWRDAVRGLMCEARLVLVIAHATHNLAWEIETLLAEGLPEKTVLLLPPVSRRSLRKRWAGLVERFADERYRQSLLAIAPQRTLLARFPPGSGVAAYRASGRDVWAYDACLMMASEETFAPEHGAVTLTRRILRAVRPAAMAAVALLIGALLLPHWSFLDPAEQRGRAEQFHAGFRKGLAAHPFVRAVIDHDREAQQKLYREAVLYSVLGPFGWQLSEFGHTDEENLKKRYAPILGPVLTHASRINLNANDPLLQRVVEQEAAALDALSTTHPDVCREVLMTGTVSLPVEQGALRTYLEALEAAYLDGLKRPVAPDPTEDKGRSVLVRAMKGPDALSRTELDAIQHPATAPAAVVCQGFARMFRNLAAQPASEAALGLHYLQEAGG
jgi:hypothetical protein